MENKNEEAVIIELRFPQGKFDDEKALDAIFEFEDILREVIECERVGIFDGNVIHNDIIMIFIYGSSADKITQTIKPWLDNVNCIMGSHILKRYGDIGAREDIIMLNPN